MIVTLDQRLFVQGTLGVVRGLSFVISAEERCHVLLTDPLWDPEDESQPIQKWLTALSGEAVEAVRASLDRGLDEAANASKSVARVRVEPLVASRWEDGVLSPADALRLMQTPLWLVLENGRNDLQFLLRILDRRDRVFLEEHLAEGRVEVPVGGGTGELKVFLEDLATLPAVQSGARQTTGWIRRLRSWVMFDRDAHHEDPAQPSSLSETLRLLCASMTRPRPFPGHQLGRRTIENYLPVKALEFWAENAQTSGSKRRLRQMVWAFSSLEFGEIRRACFAMKEGLVKDVAPAVREDLKRRKLKQMKLKRHPSWFTEDQLRSVLKRRSKTRERWLEETELPAVFRGMRDPVLLRSLNRGFGDRVAELYGDRDLDDACFNRVFIDDSVAKAWREGLVESLRAVL